MRGRLGSGGAEERASPRRAAFRPGRCPDSSRDEQPQDANRVEVVDRGCVGEVAQLGRVARDDDEVLDAQLVRPEKVRDRAEQISIAPAHVDDGLDAELVLDAHGQRDVATCAPARVPRRRC